VQALRRVRAAGIGPSSSAQPEGSGAEETWSPVASRDPLYDSEDELVQADASGAPGTGRNIMARSRDAAALRRHRAKGFFLGVSERMRALLMHARRR
jgi:hypothetical protein